MRFYALTKLKLELPRSFDDDVALPECLPVGLFFLRVQRFKETQDNKGGFVWGKDTFKEMRIM